MDITTLILEDHHEQRRMFALMDELAGDPERLRPVWERLAVLLEVHAEAEEQLFYPRLLDLGTGATGEPSADAETEDAIHDHNEIRDAIRAVASHEVGSPQWWSAVDEVREANSDHMAEEERGALADFRRHADLRTRHDLALAFATFEAEHYRGVPAQDHDPKAWVREHS